MPLEREWGIFHINWGISTRSKFVRFPFKCASVISNKHMFSCEQKHVFSLNFLNSFNFQKNFFYFSSSLIHLLSTPSTSCKWHILSEQMKNVSIRYFCLISGWDKDICLNTFSIVTMNQLNIPNIWLCVLKLCQLILIWCKCISAWYSSNQFKMGLCLELRCPTNKATFLGLLLFVHRCIRLSVKILAIFHIVHKLIKYSSD